MKIGEENINCTACCMRVSNHGSLTCKRVCSTNFITTTFLPSFHYILYPEEKDAGCLQDIQTVPMH